MTDKKIVIGIIGEIGSGKGAAARYLKEKFGAENLRFSTMLRDIMRRIHLPETRENMQTVSTMLRRTFGEDVLARVMYDDAVEATAPLIVTEGIRRPSDIAFLSKLPGFRMIYITCDEKLRFARMHIRNENADDGTLTWEEFRVRSNAETETQIPAIAQLAEYKIDNNGTADELYKNLDAVIAKIKNTPA